MLKGVNVDEGILRWDVNELKHSGKSDEEIFNYFRNSSKGQGYTDQDLWNIISTYQVNTQMFCTYCKEWTQHHDIGTGSGNVSGVCDSCGSCSLKIQGMSSQLM